MSEDYSVSARQEVDDHGGCDRLSDLPLSIIHIILALVPIRDAVRTSVLSTQWRYTWATLHQIVFDDKCANKEGESESNYEYSIFRVLFLHKGPIQRFSLSCSVHLPKAYLWLTCLYWKGIQELNLDMKSSDLQIEMQSCLYYCEKLTYLRLYFCALKPPPTTFKGFLFLRCLCIIGVISLTSDDISKIVAGCPVLESFELIELDETELKISAPNLKFMQITGEHQKLCINAPHMTEISVFLYTYEYDMDPDQELKSAARDYASCFGGFTNLQKLRGIGYFTKFMSLGIELCHHSLAFHHLKLIDLDVNFEDVKEIMVLARLLIGAPNLQQLIIISFKDEPDSEAPNLSLGDLGFAPNFKLEKLTDVSLHNFDVSPVLVEFLKILFKSAPVLETVRIDTEENQKKVRAILQGCNWVSPPTVKPCCCERKTPDRFMQPF